MDDRDNDVAGLARSNLFVKSVWQSFVSKASRIVVSKRLRESPETTGLYNMLYLLDSTQTILSASAVFEMGDHLPEVYSGIAQEAWAFIQSLSATAEAISLGKDYTLRAHKFSNDELGKLVTVFNGMLSQISAREQKLNAAKDEMFEKKRFNGSSC